MLPLILSLIKSQKKNKCDNKFREFFPPIEPYNTFTLKVSDLHTIFVEESGNKNGKPLIFLHGGPGVGISPGHRRFFDPKVWRIIHFDQRGCGQSTPFAELKENTTWDIVEDIEKIRKHLNVEKWVVFGGSWGSTLGLAYSITHPGVVKGLIIRGIWFGRTSELNWTFSNSQLAYIYPDYYEKFIEIIPENERGNILQAYKKKFESKNEQEKYEAAKNWCIWEAICCSLNPTKEDIEQFGDPKLAISTALIELHYMLNNAFLKPDDWVLKNVDKIQNIPGVIINGRYDMVTPARTSYELHKAWPQSRYEIVPMAGHRSGEPGIRDQLIRAAEEFSKY